MQLFVSLFSLVLLSLAVNCAKFEEREHVREHKKEREHVEHRLEKQEEPTLEHVFGGAPKEIKMAPPTKEALLKEKKQDVFTAKKIEYFLNNPNTKLDRECFAKMKPGQSIDFVIDLAPSPSQDKVDKVSAEAPIALFLQDVYRSPSRAYFYAVQLFIDTVTFDMKPEWTHTVIYDKGRKFFIRGRAVEDVEAINKLKSGGEFSDKERNLKTLWPVPTKEAVSLISSIVQNNLGRMTKLSLWNRDNGLPVVLNANRRSKPIYTIVITDGASGAKIHELSDDLSRTTVIDVGNRRFVNNNDWNDMKQLNDVYTLTSPQKLPMLMDTVRCMACLFIEHAAM